ncbi:MAG TPA: MarR family transcriptional regulator [Polyangiaceae bacterium]|jgi:DNA-binding MarR family transcriptional regulator
MVAAVTKPSKRRGPVTTTEYRALAAFRFEMRKFLAFSEQAARAAGVEPQQHQLLLSVRGLPAGRKPTIGAIAERLCVQHHTAVALVDKLEGAGLLRRERSLEDRRQVLLRLTPRGAALLRALSELHRAQLERVGPHLVTALGAILVPV